VDGLRFDSVVNIRGIQHNGAYECDDANGAALLQRINQQVQASQPWKLTIAEDLQGWNQITEPVASGGMDFPRSGMSRSATHCAARSFRPAIRRGRCSRSSTR